ncbi:MAG: RNA polymerase sigma factor [Oscillospiraceae bacterium]|nr:RNA polymerase sigma factor [Oscillospiraceae bacterium]
MTRDKIAESIGKYHATVYRVALGYVKNTHDADDITQDVFFKLYRHNKDFVSDEAQKAWLIRVAVNESKNLLKSAWFRKRADLDESLAAPENDNAWVYEYVQKLKPKYRTVVYLHYYEKYTAKEIAAILGKPQSTIESQMRRSKEQLRKLLTDDGIKEECCYEF